MPREAGSTLESQARITTGGWAYWDFPEPARDRRETGSPFADVLNRAPYPRALSCRGIHRIGRARCCSCDSAFPVLARATGWHQLWIEIFLYVGDSFFLLPAGA